MLYDVRGHGRSTAPTPLRGGFTLEKLTDDFLAVADAVSPDRPVHLVGHDWGSVQSWEFATVKRTEGRIASFTSMSGPSLDHFGHWIKQRMSRPTPRRVGQLLGQGAKSWYVYMLHTPVLPELAWRGPLGKQWPRILAARWRSVPAGDYPTPSLPHDAAHGAWLYRDNVRARLRRPREDAYAHVPVQLITPTGGRLPLGAALRRTGAVGTGVGATHPAGQALGAAYPAGPTGFLDHRVRRRQRVDQEDGRAAARHTAPTGAGTRTGSAGSWCW